MEYLSVEQILRIHERQLEEFGGGHGLRDRGALEDCLLRMVTDSAWRSALGQGALLYAREEADSAVCIAGIERFYLDVLARVRA